MHIKFTKLQGAGNDYLYLDAINDLPECVAGDDSFYSKLAIKASDRHFGVGSDGVIVILPPSSMKTDFRMRMFNADGSEGEMCGNGIRCFAKYVYDHRLTNNKVMTIETLAGVRTVEVFLEDGKVREAKVFMGIPTFEASKIPTNVKTPYIIEEKLDVKGSNFEISCVSMGNPHCIIFVDDVKNFDVHFYGPLIENNKMFPNRINVEFVQILDDENVSVRTWERGAGETLACGTGACAVYSVMKKMIKLSVVV